MYWGGDRETKIKGLRVTLRLSEEERAILDRAAKLEEESGGVRCGDRAVRPWGGDVMLGRWLRRAALLYANALIEESDKAAAAERSDKGPRAKTSDAAIARSPTNAAGRKGRTSASRRLSDILEGENARLTRELEQLGEARLMADSPAQGRTKGGPR